MREFMWCIHTCVLVIMAWAPMGRISGVHPVPPFPTSFLEKASLSESGARLPASTPRLPAWLCPLVLQVHAVMPALYLGIGNLGFLSSVFQPLGTRFEAQICHLPTPWPWMNYFTSLSQIWRAGAEELFRVCENNAHGAENMLIAAPCCCAHCVTVMMACMQEQTQE